MRGGYFKQVPWTYRRGRGLGRLVGGDGILLSLGKTWGGGTQAEEGGKRIIRNLSWLVINYYSEHLSMPHLLFLLATVIF